jgi:hypothetical protein
MYEKQYKIDYVPTTTDCWLTEFSVELPAMLGHMTLVQDTFPN